MKKYIWSVAAFIAASLTTASAQEGYVFTTVTDVPVTSVKNQASSGTCWCFATTSFMEAELLRKGKGEHDLSEMFIVRQKLLNQLDDNFLRRGKGNIGQGSLSHTFMNAYRQVGIVPEEVYTGINYEGGRHNHGEMMSVLHAVADAGVKNRKRSPQYDRVVTAVLDSYLGEVPEKFTYQGKEYTPKSFAESLQINPDDYVAVTSFTHHPFYEPFVLEVSDNWLSGQYHNVPVEEMKAIVDNAIENGYSVAWAADVSEGGFKWAKGYAVMPAGKNEADMEGTELSRWVKLSAAEKERSKYDINGPVEEIKVTQEMRQDMFDRQETTDDHGMVIVGIATDQNGNKYYKVQNSWTANQIYDGFFYVSEPYFLAKTMDIYVNKEAVPAAIAKKMGISKK